MARELRVNEKIRAKEVLVIGENGDRIGVLGFLEALRLARERGLDLVEVAPTATPSVCRLLDYGKFKYEQAKKAREAKKGQKVAELREVRFRPKIEAHDLETKLRLIRKLLAGGDKVKISVVFRGRELARTELGAKLLGRVTSLLKEEATVEQASKMEGRYLSMLVAPSPAKGGKHKAEAPAQAQE